jgi:alpha-D-ribose 1-methylphosphonate 5-triphosphate synthase subunit PhnH
VIEFKKCSHSFHSDCLKDWLKIKSTCPLCKKNKKEEIGVTEEEFEEVEMPQVEVNFQMVDPRYMDYLFPQA